MGPRTAASPLAATDAELLARVRDGDEGAYGELFERHAGAARRLARSLLARPHDAEDVISEVFASILVTIRRGNGPTEVFAPYLCTSIRHECARTARRRWSDHALPAHDTRNSDEQPSLDGQDPFDSLAEGDAVVSAFATLPRRYQTVLWETEVRERSHAEIARTQGTTPACVATLALRARRALSTAYLERHLGPTRGLPKACRDVRDHLAGYVRGDAGARWTRRIDDHKALCGSCALVLAELELVNQALAAGRLGRTLSGRALPPPALLGLLAKLQALLSAASLPLATAATLTVAVVAGPTLPPVSATDAADAARPREAPSPRPEPVALVPVPPPPIPVALDQPATIVTADPSPMPPEPAVLRPRREKTPEAPRVRRRPPNRRQKGPDPTTVNQPAPPPSGETPPAAPQQPAVPPIDQPPTPPVEQVTEPVVDDVVEDVAEPVVPIVEDVAEPVVPIVEDVVEPVVPIVEDAVDGVLPGAIGGLLPGN